jgi:tetratricopeptide (TPR) repeat protein
MLARPRVSLCMIVRNEEANLRDCLEPVLRLFDDIVVVDTGSTDGTKRIAAELGAAVSDFAWRDDFAAARNASLAQATGDWVMWLDADDRMDRGEVAKLAALFATLGDEPRAYVMRCLCPAAAATDSPTVLSHVRLFPRSPRVRWERRVHEQILPALERDGCPVAGTGITVRHLGYRDPLTEQRKAQRDLRLLRLEFATDPTDPVTLFNLGLAHLRVGQLADALSCLLSSHKYATGRGDWVRRLYATLHDALRTAGRPEQALSVAAEGLERFPNDPLLATARADLLAQLGDFGAAERLLLDLLRGAAAPVLASGPEETLDLREARYTLGMVYQDQGRHAEADRMFQELLAADPTYLRGWVGLGYGYIVQRRYADAEHVAGQIEKCGADPAFALVMRAEALAARGDFRPALDLIEQAVARAPKMPWARIVRAELLLKTGADLAACAAAQRDVLRVKPGHVAATRLLAELEGRQRPQPAAGPLTFTITSA